MKFAITGATGFIGKYLIKQLKNCSCSVDLYSRFPANFNEISGSKATFNSRVTDYSLSSLEKMFGCYDAVIHLAGIRYNKNLRYFSDYEENVRVSENIFRACCHHNIKNVVFASTVGVYSAINSIPYNEDSRLQPLNGYALSKMLIENMASLYNINLKSLRIAQIVGLEEREGYMLKTFINNALAAKELTVFGEGQGRRDYIYVKDVADAIINACAYPEVEGCFNIGSGVSVSHRELADKVIKILSRGKSKLIIEQNKDCDNSNILMDINKTKDILNWSARCSLEETLIDILNDYECKAGLTYMQYSS